MTDITPIIQAVIALLGVAITSLLIPLIRSKLSADQLNKLQYWVDIGVFAAEQQFKEPKSGEKKKNHVLEFLQSKGLTYDEATINEIIEAAVKKLNIKQEV